MKKHVLFIQGGGNNGYDIDAPMVDSLKHALGDAYEVIYPKLHVDESVSDFGWPRQIGQMINEVKGEVILVGHSLGASLLLKYLSEEKVQKKISGIFLLATPFWTGDEDWKKGLKLQDNFADKLPAQVPISLYHNIDDEEVPFENLSSYTKKLPQATFHKQTKGGHLFNNDLQFLSKDIKKV
jgi:predicted alpha/beta hydrolase family esterase